MYPVGIHDYSKNKVYFKGRETQFTRLLKPDVIPEQLNRIGVTKPDTKKLFAGLAAVATSVLAEFAIYTEKNEEAKSLATSFLDQIGVDNLSEFRDKITNFFKFQQEEDDKSRFEILFTQKVKEDPKREKYIEFLSEKYPNLNKKYNEIIMTTVKEPDNEKASKNLDTLEYVLKVITNPNSKWIFTEECLDALENVYSNCIEDMCSNLQSIVANGCGTMYYLQLISQRLITEDNIKKWSKVPNFGINDFMDLSFLDISILEKINKIKETTKFHFLHFKKMDSIRNASVDNYSYKLIFEENYSLPEKLKTITDVHVALYGPIFAKEDPLPVNINTAQDLQTEMLDNIIKDRQIDSIYNLVQYLDPTVLQKYNLTGDEVKFLDRDSDLFKEIRQTCKNFLINMNFDNPKMEALVSTTDNDSIYKDLFKTRHSRLRFISRFVLKDSNVKDLEQSTKEAVDALYDAMTQKLNKCRVFCYIHPSGFAPQFYLGENPLGKFVKITLNAKGSIHTIFEDYNKEIKLREEQNNIADSSSEVSS